VCVLFTARADELLQFTARPGYVAMQFCRGIVRVSCFADREDGPMILAGAMQIARD
jgi:hypothetical protein